MSAITVDIAGGPHRASPRHLMLVSADVPAAITEAPAIAEAEGNKQEDDRAPAGPKHRKPDPAGNSATMRALMALGAIAAALGISSAQQAVGDTPARAWASGDVPLDGDPESGHLTLGDPPEAPVIAATIPKAPQSPRPATKPAVRPALENSGTTIQTVAYALPEGTGKHRKPAVVHDGPRGNEPGHIGEGKHRKPAAAHDDSRGRESGRTGKHRHHDSDRDRDSPRHERDGEHAHHGRHHSDHDRQQADICVL